MKNGINKNNFKEYFGLNSKLNQFKISNDKFLFLRNKSFYLTSIFLFGGFAFFLSKNLTEKSKNTLKRKGNRKLVCFDSYEILTMIDYRLNHVWYLKCINNFEKTLIIIFRSMSVKDENNIYCLSLIHKTLKIFSYCQSDSFFKLFTEDELNSFSLLKLNQNEIVILLNKINNNNELIKYLYEFYQKEYYTFLLLNLIFTKDIEKFIDNVRKIEFNNNESIIKKDYYFLNNKILKNDFTKSNKSSIDLALRIRSKL